MQPHPDGAVMLKYQIFKLDDEGRSSGSPYIGIWRDDNEAQTNAGILLGSQAFEIWCGERKVATIKPEASRRR